MYNTPTDKKKVAKNMAAKAWPEGKE